MASHAFCWILYRSWPIADTKSLLALIGLVGNFKVVLRIDQLSRGRNDRYLRRETVANEENLGVFSFALHQPAITTLWVRLDCLLGLVDLLPRSFKLAS